jgi:hypothetical protein
MLEKLSINFNPDKNSIVQLIFIPPQDEPFSINAVGFRLLQ